MLEEMLRELVAVEEPVWDVYGLRNEPLLGKLTPDLRKEYCALAHSAGVALAREVLQSHPGLGPEELARALGLRVTHLQQTDGGSYTTFACFEEPDSITLYQGTVEAAEAALEEGNARQLLGAASVSDVLLAHELYHYYECTRPGFPTAQKLLTLWHIGSFSYRSKVVSLGEIGAMAFTRELLGLDYSPYLFDVVLLYPQNKRLATDLYQYVLGLADRGKSGE